MSRPLTFTIDVSNLDLFKVVCDALLKAVDMLPEQQQIAILDELAAAGLIDLEPSYVFRKGEDIAWLDDFLDKGDFRCVCADRELAIFAPLHINGGKHSVRYYKMFAVSNDPGIHDAIAGKYKRKVPDEP